MDEPRFELTQIGTVESPLTDPASAPKQGDEGAPDAWLNFAPAVLQGLEGLRAGDEVIVLTWLQCPARRPARTSARRHVATTAGRVQHALTRPTQPHRAAPSADPVDRPMVRRGRRFESVRGLRFSPCLDIAFVFKVDASALVRRPPSVHQRPRRVEGVEELDRVLASVAARWP